MIRNAWPYLQQIQRDHEVGRENYLHANYDPYVFYPAFTENNVLTMVRNCFIEGLNRRLKMPSAVIVLLSDQLIIEDPLYLPSEIEKKIKWILREIEAAIKIRKSSLPLKAYTFGEPRIMFVRAFHNTKANYVSNEILLKFNNTLRKLCMAKAVYTIPLDNYQDARTRCYDYDGKSQLTEGFELLWHDVIKGLKRHDESDKQAQIANTIYENTPHQQVNNVDRKDRSSNRRRRETRAHDESHKPHGGKGGRSRSRGRDITSDRVRNHRSPRSNYADYGRHQRSSRHDSRL